MTTEDAKAFVLPHFEDIVNRQDLTAADRNFASDYEEHGDDAPFGLQLGLEGPKQYLATFFRRFRLQAFPDIQLTVEDIIAEGDKVVVRNVWGRRDRENQRQIEFAGIFVIWRIAGGKLAERWAYLESPHPVH